MHEPLTLDKSHWQGGRLVCMCSMAESLPECARMYHIPCSDECISPTNPCTCHRSKESSYITVSSGLQMGHTHCSSPHSTSHHTPILVQNPTISQQNFVVVGTRAAAPLQHPATKPPPRPRRLLGRSFQAAPQLGLVAGHKLGSVVPGVDTAGVSDVGSPVVDGALAGDNSLHA